MKPLILVHFMKMCELWENMILYHMKQDLFTT